MANKNRLYPHLLPEDIALWERFLAQYSTQFQYFEYDVRVGEGRPADTSYPDNIRQMALDLSMRRIDAVGYTPSELYIIEITTSAGLKAVGQLITYPILYAQTYHPARPLHPLLVTADLQPDVLPALQTHAIDHIVLPP
jgi:hypothetical protein